MRSLSLSPISSLSSTCRARTRPRARAVIAAAVPVAAVRSQAWWKVAMVVPLVPRVTISEEMPTTAPIWREVAEVALPERAAGGGPRAPAGRHASDPSLSRAAAAGLTVDPATAAATSSANSDSNDAQAQTPDPRAARSQPPAAD